MNKAILIGRITKDPELKRAGNGSYVNFSLAVERKYLVKGERVVDFINCVVWNKPAENLAKYINKGNMIAIEGRIEINTYEDNLGAQRHQTQIVCDAIHFVETRNKSTAGGMPNSKDTFDPSGSYF